MTVFSKFFDEFLLAIAAWALVCAAMTIDGAATLLHMGWLSTAATLTLYLPGVFLGFFAISKGVKEARR
jgi:hypothetical protein